MRRVPVVAAIVFLIPFCAALQAEQTPILQTSTAPAAQPQTIHLDVLVKDQSGMPIRGLAQQFFHVEDNGQPQKLVGFKPVDTRNNPGAVHVLIVMDMINAGYNSVTWGREQLGEYLKQEGGSLQHRTSIAVITENGLKMMSGSTTDGTVLQSTFQKIGTDLRAVRPTSGWQALEQMMGQSLQQFTEILTVEQARPGRKLVLFISPGWPMLPLWGSEEGLTQAQWVFNVDVRLTDAVHDARTAIYRLDPYELGGRHAGAQDPFYYKDYLKPVTDVKQAEYPFLGLGVFAVHSGGRVLVTGKSIAGEINDAMRDAGSYYELTYAAPAADGPNQYHAVKVQVNQPGTFVQTISGYYADPENVGSKPKGKKRL